MNALAWREAERRSAEVLSLAAATTMTVKQCLEYKMIRVTGAAAIAITLPAASSALAGVILYFGNASTDSLTVVVTLGYGAGGGNEDTVTCAQGDGAVIWCDGTYWFAATNAVVA